MELRNLCSGGYHPPARLRSQNICLICTTSVSDYQPPVRLLDPWLVGCIDVHCIPIVIPIVNVPFCLLPSHGDL